MLMNGITSPKLLPMRKEIIASSPKFFTDRYASFFNMDVYII